VYFREDLLKKIDLREEIATVLKPCDSYAKSGPGRVLKGPKNLKRVW